MHTEFHSKIKHWLLDNYLKICVDVQKRRKRAFYYIDLYCGDGICECDNPKDIWAGSPKIAAKWYKTSPYPFICIFNDNDSKIIINLRKNLGSFPELLKNIFNKDANLIINDILEKIPKDEHSLFFIDPTKHTQLLWSTVESISKHESKDYYGKEFVRRPELLINHMTYTMQLDYQQHPEYIDNYYGNKKWRIYVDKYRRTSEPIHKGFLEAFIVQLREIYENEPFFIEVTQLGRGIKKDKGNVIYYLVFVTSHPKAGSIFKSFQTYVKRYKKLDWAKEYFMLKGYSSLEEFS